MRLIRAAQRRRAVARLGAYEELYGNAVTAIVSSFFMYVTGHPISSEASMMLILRFNQYVRLFVDAVHTVAATP
jgi:hypothetical protein